MYEVLSERAIELHKEYLRGLRLKLSIFEKSYPGVIDLSDKEIIRCALPEGEREELLRLRHRVLAHEMFFSSFGGNRYTQSEIARMQYGDTSHLLNQVYRLCMDSEGGFVYVVARGKRLIVEYRSEDEAPSMPPLLAIDNCEHVYFLDYGFDKERFLCRLLPYLCVAKIDEFYKIG